MWSFNRYTYFLSVFSCPVPWIFNHLRGISFKKYCIFYQKKDEKENPVLVCASVHYFHPRWLSSCVIFFELSLELNKPYILTAHRRGCFARWKKESRNDECWSFVSTDFFFFFKREGGDVDVSIPTRVSRKKTNPTTKPIFIVFIFSFMGRKGVGVYLYIFFIVLSFVKPIKACVNF